MIFFAISAAFFATFAVKGFLAIQTSDGETGSSFCRILGRFDEKSF